MDVPRQRLLSQRLSRSTFRSAEEVVAWLGAVQAQDYAAAKWALGARMHGATDDDVEQAFARGDILRTHVLRPTWHFVTPHDIRWMLALTANGRAPQPYLLGDGKSFGCASSMSHRPPVTFFMIWTTCPFRTGPSLGSRICMRPRQTASSGASIRTAPAS